MHVSVPHSDYHFVATSFNYDNGLATAVSAKKLALVSAQVRQNLVMNQVINL